MGTAQQHVDLIESWMPLAEAPGATRNKVWICEEFGRAGDADYYAWCCATQVVAAQRLGVPFLHTPSVGFAIGHAKQGGDGSQWIPRDGEIRLGDWVTYDYGPRHGKPPGLWDYFHIAAVSNPSVQHTFETVGGNEGDRIQVSWKNRDEVMGFIRPAYGDAVGSTPTKEEEVVTAFAQATNGEDRIERFSVDPDGRIVASWQRTAGALDYAPWTVLGTPPDARFVQVAVSSQKDGHLVVNGLTAFGQTWQIWQKPGDMGGFAWNSWLQLPQ